MRWFPSATGWERSHDGEPMIPRHLLIGVAVLLALSVLALRALERGIHYES